MKNAIQIRSMVRRAVETWKANEARQSKANSCVFYEVTACARLISSTRCEGMQAVSEK